MVAPSSRHRVSVCHIAGAAALAGVLGLGACAPKTGWRRTDARVCERQGPPLLCFEAEPDQPLELHVGDLVLLPGECAFGPEPDRGGSLRLRVVDGRGESFSRLVRLPTGRHTIVAVETDDDHDLDIISRDRCDRRLSSRHSHR